MKNISILVFLFASSLLFGQQKPQFTQFMYNKYAENPAYGGLERSLSVFTAYRDQYSGLIGNPKTFYVGADLPIYIWNGAVGMVISNHKAGLLSNTNLKLSYNYVFSTPVGFLSFGARAGFDFLNLDGSGIITPEGSYEGVFTHNDPNLEIGNFNGVGLSWEIGTYFMGSNIQAGITLGELPDHTLTIGDGTYKKSFFGTMYGQYSMTLENNITLVPNIMVKADRAVVQTDIGVVAEANKSIFGGISLRGYNAKSLDAICIILGSYLGPKYKVSYSYDIGISTLRNVNQGSHEIMLSYNLQKLIGIGLPPKIIYNPRDL